MSKDVLEVVVIKNEVRCVYLNGYRIVGSKPYVSEPQTTTRFEVPAGEIRQQLKRKPRSKTKDNE
ncbi:hypothetical protein D3C76_28370 [compost metagenome]